MAPQVNDILKTLPINSQDIQNYSGSNISDPPRLTLGGEDILKLSAGAVKLPLVSFVLINFNYAAFVGEAIDSIKRQDYIYFECLIIDNCSTDNSVDIIKNHIGNDTRFVFSQLPENFGQLGATLWAIERIKGGFVVFVDADDFLFPSFCSTHVQVHLALPENVALTSSNIIEINKSGEVLTGKSVRINLGMAGFIIGLQDPDIALRLSTIDSDTFALLDKRCAIIANTFKGRYWTPGTSNMFRASIIN